MASASASLASTCLSNLLTDTENPPASVRQKTLFFFAAAAAAILCAWIHAAHRVFPQHVMYALELNSFGSHKY